MATEFPGRWQQPWGRKKRLVTGLEVNKSCRDIRHLFLQDLVWNWYINFILYIKYPKSCLAFVLLNMSCNVHSSTPSFGSQSNFCYKKSSSIWQMVCSPVSVLQNLRSHCTAGLHRINTVWWFVHQEKKTKTKTIYIQAYHTGISFCACIFFQLVYIYF